MIEADHLKKTFEDGFVAVNDSTFIVRPGETLGMLGSNGAGKTTTVNMILGFIPPTSGDARIAGVSISKDPLEAKRHVGYVSEHLFLYESLTGLQNMRFFARISGHEVTPERIDACLERVGLAKDAWRRRVESYSKGMRRRLGIAIVLAKDPPAFILDEPTTGLDPVGVNDLHDIALSLKREKKAILLVTHDLHGLQKIADSVVVMREGALSAPVPSSSVPDMERLYYEAVGAKRGVQA